MIQQLLFPFKTSSKNLIRKINFVNIKEYSSTHLNFIYGNKLLQILSLGWIIAKLINFKVLISRPIYLFEPSNYFGRFLMPELPSFPLFLFIGILGGLTSLFLIFKPENIFIRIAQVFILLWMNLAQWSYGYLAHVAHLFLLSHLFALFIPFSFQKGAEEKKIVLSSIEWYYFGLLATYSLAGLWKWIGLVYKLIVKPTEISWIHPDASLFNAIISFRNYDLPFTSQGWYTYPLFWQISFLLVLSLQTLSIIGAFFSSIRVWLGLALLIFHLINTFFFKTVFILAPLTLVCLFFPYHLFFKNFNSQENK